MDAMRSKALGLACACAVVLAVGYGPPDDPTDVEPTATGPPADGASSDRTPLSRADSTEWAEDRRP
jgi:hypothetical protein